MNRKTKLRNQSRAKKQVCSIPDDMKKALKVDLKPKKFDLYKADAIAVNIELCPPVFDPRLGLNSEAELRSAIDRRNDIYPGMGEQIRHDNLLYRLQRLYAARIVKAQEVAIVQEHQKLLIELLLMSLRNKDVDPVRCVYLEFSRIDRVQEIGWRLFQIGGHSLMFGCAEHVPKYDQKELDMAWHGVGEWQA